MMDVTSFSYTLRSALLRMSALPQRTMSKLSRLVARDIPRAFVSMPPPSHVVSRLEAVFEALGDLAEQPDAAAALTLACDALQAELPSEARLAGLYDIDNDEIRVVVAAGVGCEQLRGTSIPYDRCFVGHADQEPVITHSVPDWLGGCEEGSEVLLCPIVQDKVLIGVLVLADPLCAAHFDRHDVELVRYVAGRLASVIHAQRHGWAASSAAAAHD